MLNQLRKATGTWVAKLLLILLVLSFAVWGISGEILNRGDNNVVRAGDTAVSMTDYRLAYDRQLSILSQQFGANITREQARAFGVDQQVLGQLVAGAVLDEQARQMGLGLSRDRLAALTAEDPAFHGPDGRFDRQQFDFVLRQVGMRPDDYLANRQQVAVRQQIVEAASDGITVPDTFLRAFALYRGENRTAEYVTLPASLVEPVEEPGEEELTAYFEENEQDYIAPEYRNISYVRLEPETIADPAAVSDEEARANYEEFRHLYVSEEQRTIEQLVFSDRDEAEAAARAIADGASFEDIVEEQGRSVGDVELGTFEQGTVPDQALGEAAFALEEGEVSEVIDGRFGPVLLRVTAIESEATQPFEEVEDEIRAEVALDLATQSILDVYDDYEDARAGGATMQEAAANQGLDVVTIEAIDQTGRTPDGGEVDDLPEAETLLSEAFDADAGFENPPINVGQTGYLFYEVNEVTPSRQQTLDEVRDQVVADWTAEETERRLAELAAEIEEEINQGASLSEIAEARELSMETQRGLRRESSDTPFGQQGLSAVFGVTQGGTGTISAPDGEARIVFQVTLVSQPASAEPGSVDEQLRNQFASGLGDDMLDQLVARLQSQYAVTVNQNAIRQAMNF